MQIQIRKRDSTLLILLQHAQGIPRRSRSPPSLLLIIPHYRCRHDFRESGVREILLQCRQRVRRSSVQNFQNIFIARTKKECGDTSPPKPHPERKEKNPPKRNSDVRYNPSLPSQSKTALKSQPLRTTHQIQIQKKIKIHSLPKRVRCIHQGKILRNKAPYPSLRSQLAARSRQDFQPGEFPAPRVPHAPMPAKTPQSASCRSLFRLPASHAPVPPIAGAKISTKRDDSGSQKKPPLPT